MTYNTLLALIPVLLGRLFYRVKWSFMEIILFLCWLFFVPNTIYLFTDILHFIDQIKVFNLFGVAVLAVQYAILFIAGFLTYVLSLYPVEKKLKLSTLPIVGINFLIGFGVVLGRVYRLNSWDILIEIKNVISTVAQTINSPDMLMLSVLFGLFANFMYFLVRKNLTKFKIWG